MIYFCMDIKIKFGKRLREIRINKGLSQEELAGLCNLHRTYISSVERGKRNISIVNIEKIAAVLKIKINELLIL